MGIPLPAEVDVVDVGRLEVVVALDVGGEVEVVVDAGGELAKLGAVGGAPVCQSELVLGG